MKFAAEPISDSPWLWAVIFSAVGLAALLSTGGKFGRRQAGIENKYQARAAVASGAFRVDDSAEGEKRVIGAVPEYSTPDATAIALWPLEIILGGILAASLLMLGRQLLNRPAKSA